MVYTSVSSVVLSLVAVPAVFFFGSDLLESKLLDSLLSLLSSSVKASVSLRPRSRSVISDFTSSTSYNSSSTTSSLSYWTLKVTPSLTKVFNLLSEISF